MHIKWTESPLEMENFWDAPKNPVTPPPSDIGHILLVMSSPGVGEEARAMESSPRSWHGIPDLIKCPLASHCTLS